MRGRNPGVGTEAEAVRNAAYSLAPSCELLSLPEDPAQGKGGISRSGVGHPTSVISQENVPQPCPQAGLMEAFSELRFPLPSLCQVDNIPRQRTK